MGLTITRVPVLLHFLDVNVKKRMNVNPIHVSMVEHVWMEFTTLLVFVQACTMEGVVKLFPEHRAKISWQLVTPQVDHTL